MKKHLLKSLGEVARRIGSGEPSLFLDYDGTLAPIAGRPEDARLHFHERELLRSLAASYRVAVVSGRGLADLKRLVGLEGLVYAGNHGFEINAPDFTLEFDIGAAARAELGKLRRGLPELAHRFKGVIFEDKGLILAVHYRLLGPSDVALFKERFDSAVSAALSGGHVVLSKSKKAFEIRPNVYWNKGRAVEWIMGRPGFSPAIPIYLGDDETDKDGYRAAETTGGIAVNVGGPVDEAEYFLVSQGEVRVFLKELLHHPTVAQEWLSGA